MKKLMRSILWFMNIALYLTVIATWIIIPRSLTLNISLSIFNISFTLILLLNHIEEIKIYVKTERFLRISTYFAQAFIIFFTLILFNYLAYKHPIQLDLSKQKLHTLSLKSKQVLNELPDEINFTVFARSKDQAAPISLLELYRLNKRNLNIKGVDPDLHPELMKKYNINQYGSILIEYKNKSKIINEYTESGITRALLQLTRNKAQVIGFLGDHNGPGIDQKDDNGLTHLAQVLAESSYQVKEITLIKAQDELKDIDVLAIWGIKERLLKEEINAVEEFLEGGGSVLIGLDPDFNGFKHKELGLLMEKWGINFNNDLVVDRKSHVNGSNATVPIIRSYTKHHAITKGFEGQTFFPLASSVSKNKKVLDKYKVEGLIRTSTFPDSWAERSIDEIMNGNIIFTEGLDKEGPIYLAMASQRKDKDGKLVVFGNSTFVMNAYAPYNLNFKLLSHGISWLSEESFVIPAISNSQEEQGPVMMSAPQVATIFYFSLIFGPLILIGCSIYFYRRGLQVT